MRDYDFSFGDFNDEGGDTGMTDLIKTWVLGVAGTALITCVMTALTPNGKTRVVVKLVCGLLMITAMIKPVVEYDFGGISNFISEFKADAGMYVKDIQNENDRLLKAIIEEDTAAYILDKAVELGIGECEVAIWTKKEDDGYPYPYEVRITASASEIQKGSLSKYIESELGIPDERQHWSIKNGY